MAPTRRMLRPNRTDGVVRLFDERSGKKPRE